MNTQAYISTHSALRHQRYYYAASDMLLIIFITYSYDHLLPKDNNHNYKNRELVIIIKKF